METIDPIKASDRIHGDYAAYLRTSFAPADPELAKALSARLEEPGRLRKGPLVQASPPYVAGRTPRELVGEGVLHQAFLGGGEAMRADRRMYQHQENALRLLAQHRNAVIATGTGSGKTECYLYRILDHLLRERDAGTLNQPGVRALLLYPMNALANDQLKRIRELFSPFEGITYGRYVGDTKKSLREASEDYRSKHGGAPPKGELIDRERMQEAPPHVLLTNFAMLEYLLLRPADSTLFDGQTGKHWSFVVLDEAHVYDGAKGAELAMLLRRVRDRVHYSERGRLQCIATSATLGRGAVDSPAIAQFARDLFDEDVDATDVVLPERQSLAPIPGSWSLDPAGLIELHATFADGFEPHSVRAALLRAKASFAPVGDDAPAMLWHALKDEQHVVALQEALTGGSRSLSDLSSICKGFQDPKRAVTQFVDLCVAARPDPDSASLLPARYHLFLRASEGAYVCWHPKHPPDQPRIVLDRHVHCPSCALRGITARVFELALCRLCGADYVVGVKTVDGELGPAGPFTESLLYLLRRTDTQGPKIADHDGASDDEDELALVEAAPDPVGETTFCAECGALDRTCTCPSDSRVAAIRVDQKKGGALRRCTSCNRHSTRTLASRFLSGSEAPVSVVATSLYQSLPRAEHAPVSASAEGRKLLLFSDSRQDAAFFAPYLERTYNRAMERRLLWSLLEHERGPLTLSDLSLNLARNAEELGFLKERPGKENSYAARSWVMAEILATDRRQSLDGLGLAAISPYLADSLQVPASLAPLGLDRAAAIDLLADLLDTVRQAAAVTVPEGVDVKNDLRFSPRNVTTSIRGSVPEQGVLAWVPGRGKNRRSDLLQKIIDRRGVDANALSILESLWEEITERGHPLANVLKRTDIRGTGTVFHLDCNAIVFASAAAGSRAQRCDRCRLIWWRSVDGVCPTYKCPGTLAPFDTEPGNHYRQLYSGLAALPMKVKEHTGQLKSRHAADLQEQFVRGELNVLSSSTTFELGVDVGDVQSVLMRNVPPSAANYVQRAGRAGRRLNSAALVVTFAQRRSHDLNFFEHPESMVDGHVSAPILTVGNEAIVRRHLHAVAFAAYERRRVESGNGAAKTVGDYLAEGDGRAAADGFLTWLATRPQDVHDALRRIAPPDLHDTLGIENWSWASRLEESDPTETGGWWKDAFAQIRADIRDLQELEVHASAERQHGRAGAYAKTQRTLLERKLIDFLAQRGVLPKYGFPVDMVELDVSGSPDGADRVELSRDLSLAILEFAPGASIVAAGKVWRSLGLKYRTGRELPRWEWGECETCRTIRTEFQSDNPFTKPCECGGEQLAAGRRGKFVIPMFGFVGQSDGEPGESRPPSEGRLETHFTTFDEQPPPFEQLSVGGADFGLRSSKKGWITVFNRGPENIGFFICNWCGYGTGEPPKVGRGAKATPKPHQRPDTGKDCTGYLAKIDLGHRFMTNVLEVAPGGALQSQSNESFLSFVAALLSSMPAIGITSNDVGGSLSNAGAVRAVVVFDNVPGGAGHTRHVEAHLKELLLAAHLRVSECSCEKETSCYGCLRSFRNQRDHERLSRRAALDILEHLLVPEAQEHQ